MGAWCSCMVKHSRYTHKIFHASHPAHRPSRTDPLRPCSQNNEEDKKKMKFPAYRRINLMINSINRITTSLPKWFNAHIIVDIYRKQKQKHEWILTAILDAPPHKKTRTNPLIFSVFHKFLIYVSKIHINTLEIFFFILFILPTQQNGNGIIYCS